MKVIFILNHFLPAQVAGTEVYVLALCKELRKLNILSKVIIPNYGIKKTERYFWEDIEVIKFAETSVVDRELIMGKRIPDGLPFFLEVLEVEQPDIVHFHELAGSNGITLEHVKAAKAKGFRTIFTFHLAGYSCKTGNLMYKDEVYCDGLIDIKKCTKCCLTLKNKNFLVTNLLYNTGMFNYNAGFDTTKFNSSLGTAIGFPFLIKKLRTDLHALANSCDVLVSLTNWYNEILIRNNINSNKISVIKQGLVQQQSNRKPEFKITALPLKLVFIGRISYFKGIHLLLEAIKDLPQNSVTLDIFGKDENDKYSSDCKKESAYLTNINWKGLISPSEVVSNLSNYDILCLPSTFSEMSPLVIQEAFAAEIPVLASDVYGNAEQITDNVNGWLFKFRDSTDLKNKLLMLIKQPTLIDEAKTKIIPPRSFENVASEYIDIYNKLDSSRDKFEKNN